MSIANSLYPDEKVLTGRASYFDIFERTITVFAIVGFTNFIAFALLGGADADPTAIFPKKPSKSSMASWISVTVMSSKIGSTPSQVRPCFFSLGSMAWRHSPAALDRRSAGCGANVHLQWYKNRSISATDPSSDYS